MKDCVFVLSSVLLIATLGAAIPSCSVLEAEPRPTVSEFSEEVSELLSPATAPYSTDELGDRPITTTLQARWRSRSFPAYRRAVSR